MIFVLEFMGFHLSTLAACVCFRRLNVSRVDNESWLASLCRTRNINFVTLWKLTRSIVVQLSSELKQILTIDDFMRIYDCHSNRYW